MDVHAGVGWGCGSHAVCVTHAKGRVVDRLKAGHGRDGLAGLVARLKRHGPPGEVGVAIERPSGLLVDHPVEAGLEVAPIHPDAVKARRPRDRAVSAKSDPGDAARHCPRADGGQRLAPADGPRDLWPSASPASAPVGRHPCLAGAGHGAATTRSPPEWHSAPQPTALLNGVGPGAAPIFTTVASPIALAVLDRAPTPDSARRLGRARLASVLARHRTSGHRAPEALLERLRAAPFGQAGEVECQAKGGMVRARARAPTSLVDQLGQFTRRIEATVADLPDGRVVMSFPRAGRTRAAARHRPRANGGPWLALAELGDVRDRFQTSDQLAARAGVAPVTHASGKSRGTGFRWACDKRPGPALACFGPRLPA